MVFTFYLSLVFLCLYLLGLVIRNLVFRRDRSLMQRESRRGGRVIARVEEVAPGSVRKFWLICEKYRIDAFLINYQGSFHAYVNRCRHMSTPLDFVRYQFFAPDGRHLICLTHGALYDPDTGLCTDGPCRGLALYRLPVLVSEGEIRVGCPSGDLAFLAD